MSLWRCVASDNGPRKLPGRAKLSAIDVSKAIAFLFSFKTEP